LKKRKKARTAAALPTITHAALTQSDPAGAQEWPFMERRKGERRQGDRRLGDRRRATGQPDFRPTADPSVCTDRERQVLQLLVQGMTNRQIADRLSIAEDTVKKHLQHVYKKFGVRRRALLIVDLSRLNPST
jgi:DNA-binding CsgD family transcriptional regulator